MKNWNNWGSLASRYRSVKPRKILSLDGGGIRGVITLQVLIEMEEQLRQARGGNASFRLSDYFDYIGGTSTGAIIAAGLALGKSAVELDQFYRDLGPEMFEKANLLRRFRNLYKSGPLEEGLQGVFGKHIELGSDELKCLLLVVTRNATTDSPWPISSNPDAKYNERSRADCNLRIPLWKLVRASTAAPIFFPPEVIELDKTDPDKAFVFVDGGVTPYNNPAALLYRMATTPAYKLGWERGENRLLMVSVGTGSAPTGSGDVLSPSKNAVSNLAGLPGALMYAAMVEQDTSCRTVGRCVAGAALDREIGDLVEPEHQGKAMVYARYDANLSKPGLTALGLDDIVPEDVQSLDAVDQIDNLVRVGKAAAGQVKLISQFGNDWVNA